MRIPCLETTNGPIYQQIVDYFIKKIQSGELHPGYKLPTVRELSRENQMSQGTVKHAYDTLEQLGYIEKRQGSGSFVSGSNGDSPAASKKEQAMDAIDGLLDRMTELSFSMRDIRIFLDLKLRERENMVNNVRVAAVDCSPEALSVMVQQISGLYHVDVYEYLLPTVMEAAQSFAPDVDIVVTTPTHADDLTEKMGEGYSLIRMVMGISKETLLELARIPAGCQVGILCASERFARIIAGHCEKYGVLDRPPLLALFGDPEEVKRVSAACDQLILPPNYHTFASREEQELVRGAEADRAPIIYRYQIERGSLLYLEEEVETIYQNHQKQL